MRFSLFSFAAVLLMLTNSASAADPGRGPLIFVSSFATGEEGAIHTLRLDLATGELHRSAKTTDVENPFYLALAPNRKTLYSIHAKAFGGDENEDVAAFSIAEKTGGLELINRRSALGTASCFLDVDPTGQALVLANYSSGSVAGLPIVDGGGFGYAGGSFFQHSGSSIDPKRQGEPHAHSMVISPDGKFAYAADLGVDRIFCYRLKAEGAVLSRHEDFYETALAPGSGPRHLRFHPDGKHLYAINELSNTITAFAFEAGSGKLQAKQTISTLPDDFTGPTYTADLQISADGRFLYGTNRGHDSIACYRISDDGALELIEIVAAGNKGPQNLALTADGKWLLCANMPGNRLEVFAIDSGTGVPQITPNGIDVKMPACVVVMSAQ